MDFYHATARAIKTGSMVHSTYLLLRPVITHMRIILKEHREVQVNVLNFKPGFKVYVCICHTLKYEARNNTKHFLNEIRKKLP